MDRLYQKISIDLDHWNPQSGMMGIAFDSPNGNTTNIVRCTDEDLRDLKAQLDRYFSQDTAPRGD